MDPKIGWFQPEQFGPAKDFWTRIWDAHTGLDNLKIGVSEEKHNNKSQELISVDNSTNTDSLTKRGLSNFNNNSYITLNRASTYGMNKHHASLIGIHGGCPWRPANRTYSTTGVLG